MYYSKKDGEMKFIESIAPPVGPSPDTKYTDVKTILNPGDIIILFTDGVSEAMSKKREEFGQEKVFQILKENANNQPEVIIDKIIKDLREFTAGYEQSDDISLIVMKIK